MHIRDHELEIPLSRIGAALLVLTLAAPAADAIPPFARKYGTSCQTCHIAYPKLNAYGEAFRQLGYHLPGETEEQIREKPVSLGADAYKRVWPKAVWPNEIPGNIPLAMTADFLTQYKTIAVHEDEHDHGAEADDSDFDFIYPSDVVLIAGGTAGDTISYFGEVAFEQAVEHGEAHGEVNVDHFDVRLIRPINDSMAFNVKIGAFQPELVSTFDHARRLTIANYDSMFSVNVLETGGAASVGGGGHHGGQGISLPPVGTGIELYGVAAHRLMWNAGVINGLGPGEETIDANDAKDVYGRLAYKFGGLAPDGSNADTYAGSSKAWRERSLEIGGFYYDGDGEGSVVAFEEEEGEGGHAEMTSGSLAGSMVSLGMPHSDPAFIQDEAFRRWGLDFNMFFDDLNVFGAWVEGEDELRTILQSTHGNELTPGELNEFAYTAYFIEADAVLGWPWLHGALRYETVDLPGGGHEGPVSDWERATVSLTALVRANVKSTLEYTWDLEESDNAWTWLNFGIAF